MKGTDITKEFGSLYISRQGPDRVEANPADANCGFFRRFLSAPPSPPGSTGVWSDRKGWVLGWVVCSLLVALPFLVVRFPPIADLPQHTAQIRLLGEAWQDPGGPYTIQWFTPYSLQYVILGCAWAIGGPAEAGRLGMAMIGLLWVAAAHLLAFRRERSPAAAALACALFFTSTTYWGFYGFMLGWSVFVLWLLLVDARRRDTGRWTDVVLALLVGILLYMSHILWLGIAVLWLVVSAVMFRVPIRTTILRAAGLAPIVIAAALWYPRLAAGGFTSPTVWMTTPTARVSFSWIVDSLFGGLRGSTEFGIVATLALWMLVAILQWRSSADASSVDYELLAAATMFGVLGLMLPDQRTNTILFAVRWVPIAGVLALLAGPPLRIKAVLARVVALGMVLVLSLTTAFTWRQFERIEMSGLSESLAAMPDRPRVIGLDFVKGSEFVKGRPFIQTFAYAQVLHGGRLNFSFAEFVPSLVVFRTREPRPWSRGLEWFPEGIQPTDLAHFSHALVNADDVTHDRFVKFFGVHAMTEHGRWRLYRIRSEP